MSDWAVALITGASTVSGVGITMRGQLLLQRRHRQAELDDATRMRRAAVYEDVLVSWLAVPEMVRSSIPKAALDPGAIEAVRHEMAVLLQRPTAQIMLFRSAQTRAQLRAVLEAHEKLLSDDYLRAIEVDGMRPQSEREDAGDMFERLFDARVRPALDKLVDVMRNDLGIPAEDCVPAPVPRSRRSRRTASAARPLP